MIYACFGATYVVYATFIVTSLVDERGFGEGTAGTFWAAVGRCQCFPVPCSGGCPTGWGGKSPSSGCTCCSRCPMPWPERPVSAVSVYVHRNFRAGRVEHPHHHVCRGRGLYGSGPGRTGLWVHHTVLRGRTDCRPGPGWGPGRCLRQFFSGFFSVRVSDRLRGWPDFFLRPPSGRVG